MMRSSGVLIAFLACVTAPTVAWAKVEIEKTLEVPALGVTHVVIEHPLGALTVRGWSRATVSMKAVKSGPDAETAQRLRVHGEIRQGRLHIQTRVIMTGALPLGRKLAAQSERLRDELSNLLEKPKPWSEEVRAEINRLNEELVKVYREAFQLSAGTHKEYGRAIPLDGADLALTVHVPRGVIVQARTHRGDIDAADLTGGVSLQCQNGRIFARNVAGGVRIRSDQGRQFLSTVQGTVDVDGLNGDLQMTGVRGPSVTARLGRGAIVARDVQAPLMRFSTTQGGVTLTATLQANGLLEVRTLRGDVDVRLTALEGFRFEGRADKGRLQVPPGFVFEHPGKSRGRAKEVRRGQSGKGGSDARHGQSAGSGREDRGGQAAQRGSDPRRGQVGRGRGRVYLRAEYGDVRLW